MKPHHQPVVFITGSSSGIGRACVDFFHRQGWLIAATMRDVSKANEIHLLSGVKVYQLDVLDKTSVEQAVEQAIDDFGQIDALINNAGYSAVGPFEAATEEQINRQFETNVMGLMRVTQALIPHFRKYGGGNIVNISSVGGQMTFPLYSLYHGTKWAVDGFSESLSHELRSFRIHVKIIEPGPIFTDFHTRSTDHIDTTGIDVYNDYSKNVWKNIEMAYKFASAAKPVARVIYQAASSKSKKLRYPVGGGAPLMLFFRKIMPDFLFIPMIRFIMERK